MSSFLLLLRLPAGRLLQYLKLRPFTGAIKRRNFKSCRRLFFAPLRGPAGFAFVMLFVVFRQGPQTTKSPPKACVNGLAQSLPRGRLFSRQPGRANAQGGAALPRLFIPLKLHSSHGQRPSQTVRTLDFWANAQLRPTKKKQRNTAMPSAERPYAYIAGCICFFFMKKKIF